LDTARTFFTILIEQRVGAEYALTFLAVTFFSLGFTLSSQLGAF